MDQEFTARDIGQVIEALLEGIRRGELDASSREVQFLESVSVLLHDEARTPSSV